jgi:hypothetical protein
MKIAKPFAIFAISCLAGCAGASIEQCSDDYFWYQVGWTAGSKEWDNRRLYAEQCEPFGIPPNEARYEEGRKNGEWSEAHRYPL